jgi:hypothetical protein
MTAAEIQLHLRYSAWASRKLVEAVRAVPDADPELQLMNFYRELTVAGRA